MPPNGRVRITTGICNSKPRAPLITALGLWILPILVVAVMVAINPQKRTVTPLYYDASANWWQGKGLYTGPGGMNYLPHFALAFAPFQALPSPVGDIVWRMLSGGLLAFGFWRLARQLDAAKAEKLFLLSTVIGLLLCFDALRSGQANLMFGALTVNAAALLMQQRWWLATFVMFMALAVKPLGLVLLLLAPAVYRTMIWRIALGFVAFAAFPFLFANSHYVIAQHRAMVENLRACSVVTEHRFADVNGILRSLGTPLPDRASQILRVLAGGATLALWWLGARRLAEPFRGLFLLALTTGYLMLFNPMNEVNSYVIFAPALATFAAWCLSAETSRNTGWAVVFMAFTMGVLPELLRKYCGNSFALWWHPTMTLAFLALIVWRVFRPQQAESAFGPLRPTDAAVTR
jgi:alpha-1,2-mannosyltransferase